MKILTGSQITELDRHTIEHEAIESIALMERASEAMAQLVAQEAGEDKRYVFVVGKGNNGGDGLAMARMLANAGFDCEVLMAYPAGELSEDCRYNFERLPESVAMAAAIPEDDGREMVIVDALLGTGVRGEVLGRIRELIDAINGSGHFVVSIDLPSGMKTEFGNDPENIVHANLTLTIEFPKLAMLLPEAGECCGEIKIVPIESDTSYMESAVTPYNLLTADMLQNFILGRSKFSHKGTYGHALTICGSRGMYGAAILATSTALRSGCGLVTAHIPSDGAASLHSNLPSAMVSIDESGCFSQAPADLSRYDAVGVGCGIGQAAETKKALRRLFEDYSGKIVIDADALNIIALNPDIRSAVPAGSVLTPHPGELKRLVGEWTGEDDKIRKIQGLAAELRSVVILKGAYTMVCTPGGEICFNSTGTPGMAKGGSGDVLTGLIAGLLARGYSSVAASLLGVFLHGRAGAKAAEYYGEEAMNSSDIVDFLGDAFGELK